MAENNGYTSISLPITTKETIKEFLERKNTTISEHLNTLGDFLSNDFDKNQYLKNIGNYENNKLKHITLLEKNEGNMFPKIFHYTGNFKILWFNLDIDAGYTSDQNNFTFLVKLETQEVLYIVFEKRIFIHPMNRPFEFGLPSIASIHKFKNLDDFGTSEFAEGFNSVNEISKAYYTDYKVYEPLTSLNNEDYFILKHAEN